MKVFFVFAIALHLSASAIAADDVQASSTAASLKRATELVDGYYGSEAELRLAAGLISGVLLTRNPPSNAYVQAARIVIKGGHIVDDRFQPGTKDLATEFVNRALQLDPTNVRAISLKASMLLVGKDLPGAYQAIQSGLALEPSYPWLRLHLGRYDEEVGDYRAAVKEYAFVVHGGCSNTDTDQRRAFTSALASQAFLMQVKGQEALVRQYAESADQCRDPRDAWTLGSFAQIFNQVAFFDDATRYARKALRVMNYGVARRELAMSLYGKAAQMSGAGLDPRNELAEAASLGFKPDAVVDWFESSRSDAHAFVGAVSKLVGKTKSR